MTWRHGGLWQALVPEEKMADREEQLSDEEKVIFGIYFFAMVCGTCDGLKCALPVPRSLHARVYRDPRANKKRNEAVVAARLLFLAQLPLYCEPRTEAPCTVFTQNRNGGHLKWTFAGHSIGHLLSSGKAVLTVSYVAVVKFSDRPVSLAPARYMPDSSLANTPFY